jgi:hypothetical protein
MAAAKDSNGIPMPVLSWVAVQNAAIGASSTQSAALPDDAMAVRAGIPDPEVAATIDDTDSYELLRSLFWGGPDLLHPMVAEGQNAEVRLVA